MKQPGTKAGQVPVIQAVCIPDLYHLVWVVLWVVLLDRKWSKQLFCRGLC